MSVFLQELLHVPDILENIQKLKGCKVGANGMVWKILQTKELDYNSETRPVTCSATNVGIAPIAIHTTSAHGIFFEVKAFRIWHPIDDLSQHSNLRTPRTNQTADSLGSLCCHSSTIGRRTDKWTQLLGSFLSWDSASEKASR